MNSSIYSLCFTGKASGRKRCDICRSTNHTTKSCPEEDEVDVQLPTRLKAIESALFTLATAKTEAADGPGPSTEVCRLYNNNKCRYKKCKYRPVQFATGPTQQCGARSFAPHQSRIVPAVSSPQPDSGTNTGSAAQLDLTHLEAVVRSLFSAGLAPSTLKAYRTGANSYIKFCQQTALAPFPAQEHALSLYVSYLFTKDLTSQTVQELLGSH